MFEIKPQESPPMVVAPVPVPMPAPVPVPVVVAGPGARAGPKSASKVKLG